MAAAVRKGVSIKDVKWPEDMGEDLATIVRNEISDACSTFPDHAGLGWDRMHPKCILRLSPALIDMPDAVFMMCEDEGDWPRAVALVIIALLPKTDGGFRPIGLMPCCCRVWSRVRRKHAVAWEERQKRGYLYAGKGKGANVAAWKQAIAAEAAASLGTEVQYAQALLDLV